jgi:hypothetical protein
MSWLSKFVKDKTGIPEINFNTGKGRDVLIAGLIEQVAEEKAPELLQKLPAGTLAILTEACKDETRRRLELP